MLFQVNFQIPARCLDVTSSNPLHIRLVPFSQRRLSNDFSLFRVAPITQNHAFPEQNKCTPHAPSFPKVGQMYNSRPKASRYLPFLPPNRVVQRVMDRSPVFF